VPGVRAAEGCGRSVFAGGPPHSKEVAAAGELRELAAGIS
jgi:hypothetical protein